MIARSITVIPTTMRRILPVAMKPPAAPAGAKRPSRRLPMYLHVRSMIDGINDCSMFKNATGIADIYMDLAAPQSFRLAVSVWAVIVRWRHLLQTTILLRAWIDAQCSLPHSFSRALAARQLAAATLGNLQWNFQWISPPVPHHAATSDSFRRT